MSMRIRDWTPSIRAAGKTFNKTNTEGIEAELRDAVVPPTPTHVAPFRKSYVARVGVGARHYGFRRDPPIPDEPHGMRNEYTSSAEECLKAAANFKGLSAISAENAERKYLRNRKEPLGRSAEPQYELPEKTKRDNFAFGIASERNESAKAVIYAGSDKDQERASTTDPGRQKDRKYDWAKVKIDPTKARFGRVSSADAITTKELFQPPTLTKILPHIVRNFDAIANPHLEETRNLGFGSRRQKKDYSYGFSHQQDEMGTRLLIGGSGIPPEPQDPSLGHSVCKSITLRHLRELDSNTRREKGESSERVFGCPSVRLDLPRPKYRKVTNPNNYGDEPSGASLLYPNPHGIDEELFLKELKRDEAESLLKRSGVPGVTPEQVKEALDRAFANRSSVQLMEINRIFDDFVR